MMNAQTSVNPEIARLSADPDYVDVSKMEGLILDLRYASPNNFVGRDVYGDFDRCFLHRLAAEKLRTAGEHLRLARPGWKFLIFDCLRPRTVQRILFEKVKGTAQEKYVADPDKGSIHNYGFAVDLSLADENGNEVDMGTGFDSFEAIAEPRREAEFLKSGELTQAQVSNRLILREAMTSAGFIQLPYEWWHYDALPKAEVRGKFRIVE